MKILIGYESSGVVREAFRALGHDAWSCDLLPAEDGSEYHFQCDIWEVVNKGWNMGLFHPSCTYMTNSAAWAFGDGPYHQKVKPETLVGQARRDARELALAEVRRLMDLPFPHAIENPVGAISNAIRKPDQIIQPWQFGEDASKATCLWLTGLLKLTPTNQIEPRMVNGRPRWGNQTDSGQNKLSPEPKRWQERSRTYPGIARAIAAQWGALSL